MGLLCVTTAVLLDTFLGAFNTEQMLAELGFFFYIIAGLLVGGMAVWTWGHSQASARINDGCRQTGHRRDAGTHAQPTCPGNGRYPQDTAYDRQMLYREIQSRFGLEDIFDLMFDLSINENDVMPLNNDPNQLIINIIDLAEYKGQTGDLALAVERILTPIPATALPRPEKIDVTSPPTILRHYLLVQYNLDQVKEMAAVLEIDWDALGSGSKKDKVRNMLLYLNRRNRTADLISLIRADAAVDEEE
ncbi:MAG: hypothetical protein M5U34_33200 [Chloroflexi bacterium]|nr:hypothetical protein [Chloroflexota bacterium]